MADQLLTGHVDTFCSNQAPPPELWPERKYSGVPELAYPDWMNCSGELLDAAVEKGFGDTTVFHFPEGTWTYEHLLVTSNKIANVLVDDFGLVPGNRVLLRGPNNPMMAACWFAVVKAGGVVVTTMPLLRERELRYIADKAEIRLALTDTRFAEECMGGFATHSDGSVRREARVVHFNSDSHQSLEPRMRDASGAFQNCRTAADDTAIIAFTSGTTGEGKGTMHSHRDIMAITDCFPRYVLKPTGTDIFCGSPPLAFTYALGGLLLFPMRCGASSLLLEHASPPQLMEAIERFRPTICFTAPTAYRAMHPLIGTHDISSLRQCVSAGETLPKSIFDAWLRATGLSIIDGIGATEMLHIFISAAGTDIRPGSTGRVVPGYEAMVVDENGAEVPRATVGQLAVKGPTGCRYLDNVEQQRTYVRNGWNFTGDSYVMDADGYFWYQARADDMIISGGYNIAGPEIENVLLEHAAVAECAVVGEPDEKRGRIVKAFIVLRTGYAGGKLLTEELQNFVKARIAPYKYPRAIEYTKALPRTSTGKVQRYRLRESGHEHHG